MSEQRKMLLHIPHAHTEIPPKYLNLFPNKQLLARELLRMTDHYTNDLFSYDCDRVEFPFSRLVCDVERFRAPEDECMSQIGMWVCYESASDGQRLAEFGEDHKQEILKQYYDPHHQSLESVARIIIDRCGEALIVDCHSFASPALPYEPDQSVSRPDFCIGTDDYHTPESLSEAVKDYLQNKGYSVARNRPFSGAIVPISFLWREKRVKSIMIEVNRALYMNQNTAQRNAEYEKVKADIGGLLELLHRHGDKALS